jgi:hypothetical protein
MQVTDMILTNIVPSAKDFHPRFLVPTYGGARQLMPYDISESMHTILLQFMAIGQFKHCLD